MEANQKSGGSIATQKKHSKGLMRVVRGSQANVQADEAGHGIFVTQLYKL
jgi:hypothetical protein